MVHTSTYMHSNMNLELNVCTYVPWCGGTHCIHKVNMHFMQWIWVLVRLKLAPLSDIIATCRLLSSQCNGDKPCLKSQLNDHTISRNIFCTRNLIRNSKNSNFSCRFRTPNYFFHFWILLVHMYFIWLPFKNKLKKHSAPKIALTFHCSYKLF